jgi:hypothetical protein
MSSVMSLYTVDTQLSHTDPAAQCLGRGRLCRSVSGTLSRHCKRLNTRALLDTCALFCGSRRGGPARRRPTQIFVSTRKFNPVGDNGDSAVTFSTT